jgi:NAD(P)H-hydrate epimerase
MTASFDGAEELTSFLAERRRNAVLLGPGNGLGEGTRENVLAALAGAPAVVLDADALTTFAAQPESLFAALRRDVVLTPHGGEFERLFPDLATAEAGGKLAATRAAAARAGAVVLHKGPDTVIAEPGGRALINANAPPELATAGSGDVLAGFVLGLVAQGLPAFEAAAAATWLHGAAAAAFGPGLIAEDIAEALPGVWRGLAEVMLEGDRG